MPAVLCRVDGGGNRGLGHLQRCLALSQALHLRDIPVVFLAPALEEIRRRIVRSRCAYVPLAHDQAETGEWDDRTVTLVAARANGCHVVLVDSYQIDDTHLAALREGGCFVVAIDDLARHAFSAHLVVNAGADAAQQSYRSVTGDTTFLLGPRYALLRRAFWNAPPRVIAPRVRRVLVTVGGGDPHGVVPRILDVLEQVPGPLTVVVVRGPFASALGNSGTHRWRHRVDFVDAPDDLHELMLGVDLAVSAAGHTLYELAATGTPTVAVQVFDNQTSNRRHLTAEGVVRDGGGITDADFEIRLSAVLNEVTERYRERIDMSAAGQRLVDGCGAARVAQAIAADVP